MFEGGRVGRSIIKIWVEILAPERGPGWDVPLRTAPLPHTIEAKNEHWQDVEILCGE